MNLSGLRQDGRRAGELRQVSVELGHDGSLDGSACFEIGQTRILAEVSGPHEVQSRRQDSSEQALIKVEFSPAPFSESDRKRRRGGGSSRQNSELVLAVQKSLEATVIVENYPHTQIDVFLTVLQDDGARLPACINAASLAIVNAGIAMTDLLVSCSVGLLKGVPIVDLNFREQGSGGTFLPVAIHPSSQKVVLCTMNSRLQLKDLQPLLDLAVAGCQQVHSVLVEAVRDHTQVLMDKRKTVSLVGTTAKPIEEEEEEDQGLIFDDKLG